MAQFDVYRNPSKTTKKFFPYLVDIQSPYISELATRMVIPLGVASYFGNEAMKSYCYLHPKFPQYPKVSLKTQSGLLSIFVNK